MAYTPYSASASDPSRRRPTLSDQRPMQSVFERPNLPPPSRMDEADRRWEASYRSQPPSLPPARMYAEEAARLHQRRDRSDSSSAWPRDAPLKHQQEQEQQRIISRKRSWVDDADVHARTPRHPHDPAHGHPSASAEHHRQYQVYSHPSESFARRPSVVEHRPESYEASSVRRPSVAPSAPPTPLSESGPARRDHPGMQPPSFIPSDHGYLAPSDPRRRTSSGHSIDQVEQIRRRSETMHPHDFAGRSSPYHGMQSHSNSAASSASGIWPQQQQHHHHHQAQQIRSPGEVAAVRPSPGDPPHFVDLGQHTLPGPMSARPDPRSAPHGHPGRALPPTAYSPDERDQEHHRMAPAKPISPLASVHHIAAVIPPASGLSPSHPVVVGGSSSSSSSNDAGFITAMQHTSQPQRKRLRISRACDECRRRKTRCDIVGAFPGEPGHPLTIAGVVPPLEPNMEPKGDMLILQPCMNCRRSDVTCSYSKRPLKRGPSKGYIKDLERRLNSLESQMVHGDKGEDDIPEPEVKPAPSASASKGKVRTEDRISRLESVLARPSAVNEDQPTGESNACSQEPEVRLLNVKVEDAVQSTAAPHDGDRSDVDELQSRTPSPGPTEPSRSEADSKDSATKSALTTPEVEMKPATFASDPARASVLESQPSAASANPTKEKRQPLVEGSKTPASLVASTTDKAAAAAEIKATKAKVLQSFLHGTFPVISFRRDVSSSGNDNIARLEDRVLARGMRLLVDPVDATGIPKSMEDQLEPNQCRSGTPLSAGSKAKTHAAKVANLVGQASAGLGTSRDELALQGRMSVERLRAMRKIAHRLSGQEADLLMLCHLDHLRNGQNNNSALAAAVSKLGSGSGVQDDRDTYRRRTLLFMLDRWHAVAFGTPHLLTGRFGMERHSFRAMKDALGDVSGSPLEDGVYEVLRASIMLGQLDDLAQNGGGWKSISFSDVEAVIHSASDENERSSGMEPGMDPRSSHTQTTSSTSSSRRAENEEVPNLLSTAALRFSLESMVRCYHALHTLPIAKEAKINDVQRIFTLAEQIVVLGSVKTPISLQGKLINSAIGPHVLSIAGVAFSWCLRMICRLVSSINSGTGVGQDSQSQAGTSSSSSTDVKGQPSTASGVEPSEDLLRMEYYRRKILDYVRMCGPFCMFSGGSPDAPGSFKGVYLRLALFFNQAVSFATEMGQVTSNLSPTSPASQESTSLGNEADNLLEMSHELGALGYILASTTPKEAWKLLSC